MSRLTLTAFKCVSLDPTASRMFTVGKTYPIHRFGGAVGTGYVVDDLNRERFISTSHTFIVENNSRLGRCDVRRAHFEPVFTPKAPGASRTSALIFFLGDIKPCP